MKARAKKHITQRWFKDWSNEYDATLGSISFHKGLLELVVALSGVRKHERVLDIGCGTGLLSLKFLQKADCFITGIDSSKEMLAILKEKLSRLGLQDKINCRLMDASRPRFRENSFDLVASTVTLHHLRDKLKPLKRIFRVLRPGGRLVIGEIDMDTTGRHTDTKRLLRILDVLEQEWVPALKEAGVEAFARMFVNGKKHILNEGEYCLSLRQWASLCRRAGFRVLRIEPVAHHPRFKALLAQKPWKEKAA